MKSSILFSVDDLVREPMKYWELALEPFKGSVRTPDSLACALALPKKAFRYMLFLNEQPELILGNHESHMQMVQDYLETKKIKEVVVQGGGYVALFPERQPSTTECVGFQSRYHIFGTRPWMLIFYKQSDAYKDPSRATIQEILQRKLSPSWMAVYEQGSSDQVQTVKRS